MNEWIPKLQLPLACSEQISDFSYSAIPENLWGHS